MLETASNVIQASLNTTSGEIKQLPVKPSTPAEAPAPAAVPDQIAAQAQPQTQSTPDAPAAPPKSDQFSKGFAAMAKKDRELRMRHAQQKEREAKIAEREAQIARFEQLRLQNPVEAVKALGLTYEEMTNFQLQGGQTPTAELEIKNIKEQMAAYIQKQEAEKQAAAQRLQQAQNAQVQATLNSFKSEVADFAKSKPDEYKLTNLEGEEAYDLIASTVEQHFYQTKQIMPKEQAAKLVEEYLREDAQKKWAGMGYQAPESKAAQPSASQSEPGFSSSARMEKAMNTLSGPRPSLNNTMTGSTPSLVSPKLENNRMQKALAALSK